jgi:AraC-like DNA-binding protein
MISILKHFPELKCNGLSDSRLKGVRFFKDTQSVARRPMIYDPGICIVAQGYKIGYLGDRSFRYDANNYLVTMVTMPFECETFATPEEPLLGLFIDIDIAQLHDLIGRLGRQSDMAPIGEKSLPHGIGPAVLDEDMADALNRLIKALQSESDAEILGPGLVREVLYRTLCGSQAPVLYSLAMYSGAFSQVARALAIIQKEYANKLDVDQLAQKANMSPSAFFRAFKEVTSDSPIQYLKKIRLTRARDLMMNENIKTYMAADRVGYESPSQFSREFKRYFNQTPAEMMREMHA